MTDYRPPIFNSDSIGFHITSSDHELLSQVRKHLHKNGYLAISDTAGRLHYIMDGSRGVPYAARRVLESVERQADELTRTRQTQERRLPEAVDMVLDRNGIRTELKGRTFLRSILLKIAADEHLTSPSCKQIYPETAAFYHVSASHVERDIRYAFTCARKIAQWPDTLGTGNSAGISYLCSEVRRELRRIMDRLQDQDNDFDVEP